MKRLAVFLRVVLSVRWCWCCAGAVVVVHCNSKLFNTLSETFTFLSIHSLLNKMGRPHMVSAVKGRVTSDRTANKLRVKAAGGKKKKKVSFGPSCPSPPCQCQLLVCIAACVGGACCNLTTLDISPVLPSSVSPALFPLAEEEDRQLHPPQGEPVF